jgi:hypothetical protein
MSACLSSMRKMLRCLDNRFLFGIAPTGVPQSLCSDFSFFKQAWICFSRGVRMYVCGLQAVVCRAVPCRVCCCVCVSSALSLKGKSTATV